MGEIIKETIHKIIDTTHRVFFSPKRADTHKKIPRPMMINHQRRNGTIKDKIDSIIARVADILKEFLANLFIKKVRYILDITNL